MASGRVAACVLVLFLWPLALRHVLGADRTFASFISTSTSISRSHPRQSSPVVCRVREKKKKVRGEGRKQKEARRAQVRPKAGTSIPVLLRKLHAAAQQGDLHKAESIFDLLLLPSGEEFTVSERTINALVVAAAKRGNIERAKHWFERLFDFNLDPGVTIFTSMILAGAEYGNIQFAEEWFEAMEFYRVRPDIAAYGALVKAAANAKDLPRAEKWFRKAQEAGLRPNRIMYNLVMKAAAKAKDMKQTEWWFEQGRSQAGMVFDAVACTTLLNAAKECGDLAKAEAFYEDFMQTGQQPTFQILNALIGAAANAQRPEEAAKWFETMTSLGLQRTPRSYASLLNAWFRAGNADKLWKAIECMEHDGVEVSVIGYTMAIQSFGKGGRRDEAERVGRRMIAKGVYPNKWTLSTLERAVGAARYLQLKRELKLDVHMDKIVDQTARQIAQRSVEAATRTDAVAVKAKLYKSITAEA
ncbi:unnamed protein product [Symbiodinium sp. CCMP2592]|nr:unnamed protein product [Symbiodinium sp. CCMP2592]